MVNRFRKQFPFYPDDSDYTTNAPSYYDDLARKQKLIQLLAEKIWEYENTLDETLEQIEKRLTDYILENDLLMNERLENWDKRIDEMPEEMRSLFVEWLNDGTLEQIINHDVLGNKADKGLDVPVNVLDYEHLANGNNWTEAIQSALNENSRVFLPKGHIYNISETIFVPDNHVLMLEGYNLRADFNDHYAILRPTKDIDVVELGDGAEFTGGSINTYNVDEFTKACVVIDYSEGFRYNNKINTALIGKSRTGIGVHIRGQGSGGEGFGTEIRGWISWFDVGIKADRNDSGGSWYTGLKTFSTIMNCTQAIVANVGDGGHISGVIQPLTVQDDDIHSEPRAIVELGRPYFYMDAYIWDTDTAINEYGIHLKRWSINNEIVSTNKGRILNESIGISTGINALERKNNYRFYPPSSITRNSQFVGMQDNLLLGAHKRFDVTISRPNRENVFDENAVFTGDDRHTNISLFGDVESSTVYYEINFGTNKYFHNVGIIFNGGQTPSHLRIFLKINDEWEEVYSKNPNEQLIRGKDEFGSPIIVNYQGSVSGRRVSGVRYELSINPEIDGKRNVHILNMFYKDGSTENYLPSYGGNLYGDLRFSRGYPIVKSPDGSEFRLMVTNTGELNIIPIE